jgi:hypothetical protein
MSNALIFLQGKDLPKDSKEIELVNVVQFDDDTSTKRKAKVREIISFENIEMLLGAIAEFKDICKPNRLNLDTEPDKIDKFREMLKDPVRESYDVAKSVVEDDPASAVTFDNVIKELLSEEIDADAYQHQLAYISRVRKPHSLNNEPLSVNMFHQRVKVILKRMTLFPGAPNDTDSILGGEELAYTIFYAMPTAHQQKWKEKGIGAFSSAPIKRLLKHFQVLWEVDQENKGRLNDHLQSHNDDRKRGYKGRDPPASNKSARKGGFKPAANRERNGNSNVKTDRDHGKMKNPCEYHNGVHPWADCFGNKNGKNYKEGFKLPEKGKWQPKPRRENGGDAHHIHESQARDNAAKTTVSFEDQEPRGGSSNESHWIDKIQ